MLKIVICDEDKSFIEYLSIMLTEILTQHRIDAHIVLMHDNINAVNKFLNTDYANIFFMDVLFGRKPAGIELAKRIRKEITNAYIVYVTNHHSLVFKSFRVHPFDFVPKPTRREIIEDIVFDILEDYNRKTIFYGMKNQKLNVKSGSSVCQVPCEEIFFIERDTRKIAIHTSNEIIRCYESLENVLNKLHNNGAFMRCHRSCIINKHKVEKIDLKENEIIFINGEKCWIGKTHKKAISSLFVT